MNNSSRQTLAILLPTFAWFFVALISLWVWVNDYRPNNWSTSTVVFIGQVAVVDGGVLCIGSLLLTIQAVIKRQLKPVLLIGAIASANFLIQWFPVGVEGLLHRWYLY